MNPQLNREMEVSTGIQDSLRRRLAGFHWENLFLFMAFLLMCGAFTALSPAFLTFSNILNVLRQSSIVLFLASGQTLALLSAGIDLSQGSIVSLVSVITADVMMRGYGVFAGILAGVGVGTLCGFISGLWVGKARLNPFIMTLGMNYMASGVALLYTGGDSIFGLPKESLEVFGWIGEGDFCGLPIPLILGGLNLAIMYFFLNHTKLGRHIYVVGGSEEAAIVSGINVSQVKVAIYTLSGLLSASGGVILSARCISGQPILGGGTLLMESIGATVIGGTSLFGGEGGILRTVLGVLIMAFGVNGLNLLATSTYMQDMIVGGIIIFSVWIGILRRREG
jgi:inositol transport system permease protein